MAKAISASCALMMRLRVAIAVPPQMQVPPPTRMEVFSETPIFLPTIIATVKESRILKMISGRARTPVPMIAAKESVPPVAMMPQLRNCLEQ